MMVKETRRGAGKLTLMGIFLIVVGAICCVSPSVAGEAVTYVLGFLLLATGILQVVQGLREERLMTKLLPVILGVLTVVAGGAILAHPLIGMTVLTLVLAMCFVCDGIWKIIVSFSFRPASGWIGLLVSGIAAIVLGGMIWSEWPESGLVTIGILIGVNLLITGIALIFLATTVRKLERAIDRQSTAPSDPAPK